MRWVMTPYFGLLTPCGQECWPTVALIEPQGFSCYPHKPTHEVAASIEDPVHPQERQETGWAKTSGANPLSRKVLNVIALRPELCLYSLAVQVLTHP